MDIDDAKNPTEAGLIGDRQIDALLDQVPRELGIQELRHAIDRQQLTEDSFNPATLFLSWKSPG